MPLWNLWQLILSMVVQRHWPSFTNEQGFRLERDDTYNFEWKIFIFKIKPKFNSKFNLMKNQLKPKHSIYLAYLSRWIHWKIIVRLQIVWSRIKSRFWRMHETENMQKLKSKFLYCWEFSLRSIYCSCPCKWKWNLVNGIIVWAHNGKCTNIWIKIQLH